MIRCWKIGGIHYARIGRLTITWSIKRKAKPAQLLLSRIVASSSDRGVLRRAGLMCSPYNELED